MLAIESSVPLYPEVECVLTIQPHARLFSFGSFFGEKDMKTLLTAAAALTFAGAASAGVAGLPVLLIVDNTDPNNVTFTATGAAAGVEASTGSGSGFTLQGLFSGAGFEVGFTPGGGSISGTLQANGMTAPYVNSLNQFGSLTDNDLNIWGGGGGTQLWNTDDAAFSGSSSTDILAGASFNGSGLILLGDAPGTQPPVIGTWQLIPTPGTAGLLGLAGLAAVRRRR